MAVIQEGYIWHHEPSQAVVDATGYCHPLPTTSNGKYLLASDSEDEGLIPCPNTGYYFNFSKPGYVRITITNHTNEVSSESGVGMEPVASGHVRSSLRSWVVKSYLNGVPQYNTTMGYVGPAYRETAAEPWMEQSEFATIYVPSAGVWGFKIDLDDYEFYAMETQGGTILKSTTLYSTWSIYVEMVENDDEGDEVVDLDTYYSNRLADVEFCRSINSSSFQNTAEETSYEVVTSGPCNRIEFDEKYSISGGYLYPLQGLCSKCKQISATWSGWSDGDFEKRLRIEIGGTIRFQCTTTPQSGWYTTSNERLRIVVTNTSGGFSSLNDSNVVGSAFIYLDSLTNAFTPSAQTIVVPFETTIEIPYPDDSTASSFSGAIWIWDDELRIVNLRDINGDTIQSGTAKTEFDMYSSMYRISVSKHSAAHTYVPDEVVTYSQVLDDAKFVVADENKYSPNRCVQERHLLNLEQRSAIKVSSWKHELTEEQKTNLYGTGVHRDSYQFSGELLENPEYSDPSTLSSAVVYTGVDDVGKYSLGEVSDSSSTDSYYDVDIYMQIPQVTYTFPDKYVDTREIIFPIKINGESHSITCSQTSLLKTPTFDGNYQSSLPSKTLSRLITVPGVRTNAGGLRKYALYNVEFETPLVTMKYSYGDGTEVFVVKGKVVDQLGNGLQAVSVTHNGTATGIALRATLTDVDGNFQLEIPADTTTITFTKVRYVTKSLDLKKLIAVNGIYNLSSILMVAAEVNQYYLTLDPDTYTYSFPQGTGSIHDTHIFTLNAYLVNLKSGTRTAVTGQCTYKSSSNYVLPIPSDPGGFTIQRPFEFVEGGVNATVTATYVIPDDGRTLTATCSIKIYA